MLACHAPATVNGQRSALDPHPAIMDSSDQWLFPLSALRDTPSEITLQEEMSRRQKGVDWLFRVGVSLGMSVSSLSPSHLLTLAYRGLGPCLTAAAFFHRFYMRRMLEDYPEKECGFHATLWK